MASVQPWQNLRGQASYRLPRSETLGWWAAVACLLAVLLHAVLFYMLGRIKVGFGAEAGDVIQTEPVVVEQVNLDPSLLQPPPPLEPAPIDPPKEALAMVDEIDMLRLMPEDTEIDVRPDIKQPDFELKIEQPAMTGNVEGDVPEPVAGPRIDTELAEIGRLEQKLQVAPEGQVVVDPGSARSDLLDPDKFTEEMLRKGAQGVSDHGVLKDFTTLEDMLALPGQELLDKKAMIGSDLLFDYNSDQLRESAKVSLMKVALLVDRNPGLCCWLEGHTDLIGGDEFNLDLSRRRAAAVKAYLVDSMRLPAERLVVRGFGKGRPIVPGGTVEEQSLNRRVEIRMRKERTGDDPVLVKPKRAIPVPERVVRETLPPSPPKAVVVPEQAPKARPVAEPPKAKPVEEAPPKATPVPEDAPPAPRAVPVEP